MVRIFARLFGGLCFTLCFCSAFANNLNITNVALGGSNTLTFDIAWDNSWRVSATAPHNYDAVWIFVKYRDCASNQWTHADIDSVSAAAPLSGNTVSDQKGVMIYRAGDGTGNVSATNVLVRLNGVPAGNYDFQVFGIEMVYIPSGAYDLGDGVSTATFRTGTQTAVPYRVTTENAITVSNSGAFLYAANLISAGSLPAAYPKGFAAFYIMKYEISQEQYASYLNTLTSTQAAARYLVTGANRYTLTGAWPTIAATSGNRACNWLNWDDISAYFDWAALRPCTELEFEKATRGVAGFVPGEYAWGTTLIVDANALANDGTPTETATTAIPAGTGIASYNNNNVLGPIRVGYNGTGTSNRLTIGAGYYGICEASGNLWERYITAGNNAGRAFTRVYGDGALTSTGFSNVATWPATAGTGLRGGAWSVTATQLRISDRSLSIHNNNSRFNNTSSRGGRD